MAQYRQYIDRRFESKIVIDEQSVYTISNNLYCNAYAVYSDDDNSLRFYRSDEEINVCDNYRGRAVTMVYTVFKTEVPWYQFWEKSRKWYMLKILFVQ